MTHYALNKISVGRIAVLLTGLALTASPSFAQQAAYSEKEKRTATLKSKDSKKKEKEQTLGTATVSASPNGVKRINRSAFQATAIDAKSLHGSTMNLSDALSKVPGMKVRESGGVGSDLQLMMDGFSGKHIKVFIDGVPQEGVGSSFSLNNLPISMAERIEVYKGVVPVGFGTDAIGGVINVVTGQQRRPWQLDASYSYGSFNTHKSHVNFSRQLKSGFSYEVNLLQNYSDNDYRVNAPIEDFETGRIDKTKLESVRRFNDTYRNEAATLKAGFRNRPWADQLMVQLAYAQMYKEIQTGVRQEIVYGEKHRRAHSWMPGLTYSKRDLFTSGLDFNLTANYNHNVTTQIDTAGVKYNWAGESRPLNSPGEQSYQHSRAYNRNWNATASLHYRLGRSHRFSLNYTLNHFTRRNASLLTAETTEDAIRKQTTKHIAGLQYKLTPSALWNLTTFTKLYHLQVAGPLATTSNAEAFVRRERKTTALGYGTAATYFVGKGLQAKLSYEKAYRLPTVEESLGDEDLESGDLSIRPESSHNLNLSFSYSGRWQRHVLSGEAGFITRLMDDYIQRNIVSIGGGKYGASYVNYGKVRSMGYTLSLRYNYGPWLSLGGNWTGMEVRDRMKTALGSTAPNVAYGDRMPNKPYRYADVDLTLSLPDLGAKGNRLSLTYDYRYVAAFCYYSNRIGSNQSDYEVPTQHNHNLSLSYSIRSDRYRFSLEGKNLGNARLYDNFSLQKPGRAFYGKVSLRLHD